MMKWIDPSHRARRLRLVGPAHGDLRRWEDTVLQHTFDHVEYISLHTYLNNYDGDTPAFLASVDLMDNFIDEVVAIADAVAARRRSAQAHHAELRRMERLVSHAAQPRRPRQGRLAGRAADPRGASTTWRMRWPSAACCISLLNHADRVTAACLAQLVNVIAPIMTETGGPAWRQTIFHPFAHFSRLGRGRVLRAEIDSPTYAARYNDPHGPIDELLRDPGGALPQALRRA